MEQIGKRTLDGWKEIAAHFRVSIRTAQQWEAERGLPVQRMAGGRGRVWARVEELETWRAGQAALPAAPRRPSVWPVAVALAVFTVASVAGLIAWMRRVDVAVAHHDGSQLVAKDAKGRVLWTYRFGNTKPVQWGTTSPRALIADVDDDGSAEVLSQNNAEPGLLDNGGLFCFSPSGNLKWRFKPGKSVRTAQGGFDPPYHVTRVVPFRVRTGGPPRLAVISIHSIYFPCQVAVLDGRGELLREYWHAGHLQDIKAADLNRDGKVELYVVGLSNGHENAVALALDPEKMEGAGWESNPDYQFESMKPGVEIVRWLTPRTPLSKKLIRYNYGFAIDSSGNGIHAVIAEFAGIPDLSLCLSFGPLMSKPQWTPCDIYRSGLAQAKALGLASKETIASEVRGADGFRDATSLHQAARSKTTERPAAQ